MTTTQDIVTFLDSIAPRSLKMEWDNVGLLCGRSDKEIHTVLVALDPFSHVCREATELGADLLVTHHPLIFQPLSSITDQTSVGQAILELISHDIAAVNAHTNLDCADGGVNDTLAQCLGLKDIKKVPADMQGLLRQGQVPTQSLDAFLAHVKKTLQCPGLRYADGGKSVHKVAVGGGSCGSELPAVLAAGCDTFVTADVKYNQFWDAKELGINIIDAGHFYTENPVVPHLAEQIQAAFPELQVIISQKHRNCTKFF